MGGGGDVVVVLAGCVLATGVEVVVLEVLGAGSYTLAGDEVTLGASFGGPVVVEAGRVTFPRSTSAKSVGFELTSCLCV